MSVSRGWTWIDETTAPHDPEGDGCAKCGGDTEQKNVSVDGQDRLAWMCVECGHVDVNALRRLQVETECDELAKRWSSLQTQIENKRFQRQADYDEGRDDEGDYMSTLEPEELAKYEARKRLADELQQREIEAIEEALASRNARMMRPYEHWNEDERYMEWAERDRDDDY